MAHGSFPDMISFFLLRVLHSTRICPFNNVYFVISGFCISYKFHSFIAVGGRHLILFGLSSQSNPILPFSLKYNQYTKLGKIQRHHAVVNG